MSATLWRPPNRCTVSKKSTSSKNCVFGLEEVFFYLEKVDFLRRCIFLEDVDFVWKNYCFWFGGGVFLWRSVALMGLRTMGSRFYLRVFSRPSNGQPSAPPGCPAVLICCYCCLAHALWRNTMIDWLIAGLAARWTTFRHNKSLKFGIFWACLAVKYVTFSIFRPKLVGNPVSEERSSCWRGIDNSRFLWSIYSELGNAE